MEAPPDPQPSGFSRCGGRRCRRQEDFDPLIDLLWDAEAARRDAACIFVSRFVLNEVNAGGGHGTGRWGREVVVDPTAFEKPWPFLCMGSSSSLDFFKFIMNHVMLLRLESLLEARFDPKLWRISSNVHGTRPLTPAHHPTHTPQATPFTIGSFRFRCLPVRCRAGCDGPSGRRWNGLQEAAKGGRKREAETREEERAPRTSPSWGVMEAYGSAVLRINND